MISHSIVVASAKGGAGKTSVAVNLASMMAAAGWRILAVDLDGQANLTLDLGAMDSPDNDNGQGLLAAALGEVAPTVVRVSDHLAVIPAGPITFQLANTLTAKPDPQNLLGLSRAIERVAGDYDLVVIDTPPTGSNRIVDAALGAGHYVLVPTPPDPASLNGLHLTASAFSAVRQTLNPELRLLGVVLFRIPTSATAIRAEARAELEAALGSTVPVYTAVIRDALRAAVDMRRFALSAEEYGSAASSATPWYEKRLDTTASEGPAAFSQAATGLAADYRQLVREVMADFTTAQKLAAA